MWKKDEGKNGEKDGKSTDKAGSRSKTAPAARRTARSAAEQATIGSSIKIRGEVSGDEDLIIQGDVDGSVELEQNAVTVGPDGRVKASIIAKVITVEGRVEGDLSAEEKILLRSSASVEGDIAAPRIELEDGAHFRGGVDMGDEPGEDRRGSAASPTNSRKAPKASRPSSASIKESGQKESSSDAAAEVPT